MASAFGKIENVASVDGKPRGKCFGRRRVERVYVRQGEASQPSAIVLSSCQQKERTNGLWPQSDLNCVERLPCAIHLERVNNILLAYGKTVESGPEVDATALQNCYPLVVMHCDMVWNMSVRLLLPGTELSDV
jgi:hypothetical protein